MAREETIVLDFEVSVDDSIESIDKLTAANKELRKERNALNIATEQGQKRAAELNAKIDDNTSKIKANVSAIEKQKINIGNYKSALDGLAPGLGGVADGLQKGVTGFKGLTASAKLFILTGIGAIIAALVAAFQLLKAAISTNNEFLDKFENITNAIGVVIDVVINRVGKLGEALIALVNGNFSEAADLTSAAFSGLADEIGNAVRASQLYLDLSRDLEDAQRALRIETAKQENEIKRLVVAAKNRNLTFDEQEALLRKALVLEEQLVDKRAELAQKDLVITAKQISQKKALYQSEEETFQQFLNRITTNGKLADDEVDEIIGKIEAVETARGSSLAFQEKLENSLAAIQEKRAAALEKQNAALREAQELAEAERRARQQIDPAQDRVAERGGSEIEAQVDLNSQLLDINDVFNAEIVKRNNEAYLADAKNKQAQIELKEQVDRAYLGFVSSISGTAASLFEQDSAQYKVLATAQALINTYLAATAALASGSQINPIFGILSAAAAVANGLASVAKINGIEFAEGGWTGPGPKMKPVGVVHADEYVVPKHVLNTPTGGALVGQLEGMRRGYADGGYTTNQTAAPINQQIALANIFKNLPPQEVSVKEITKYQKRVKVKEQISKR